VIFRRAVLWIRIRKDPKLFAGSRSLTRGYGSGSATKNHQKNLQFANYDIKNTRVVDPDPDWIQIQRLCGSGSVLGIRIQGLENKEISVEKKHFLVI
jgi:hypothetical protein